jgi:hypothetical protein
VPGRAAGGPDQHRLGDQIGVVGDVDEGLEHPLYEALNIGATAMTPSAPVTASTAARSAGPGNPVTRL